MSGTYLHFPRRYEIDDCFFVFLARLIRHEVNTNIDHYPDKLGLRTFVADMEKYGWHQYAQTVINFSPYCGNKKSYPEFVKCLDRVRELLLSFGEEVPEEWRVRLKITPDDTVYLPEHYPVTSLIYWLDCLRKSVEQYEPFIGITTFPFPPAAN